MASESTPISRGALERVLARAAELQSAAGDQPEADMTEGQLIELGKEVGLSADSLKQALAEERARGEPDTEAPSLLSTLMGGRRIAAQRTVPGAPDTVFATLDRWMQRQESMRVKRHQRERMVWEPKRDVITGLLRALSGKTFALSATTEVGATVAGIDGARSVVALSADMSHTRAELLGHAIAATAVGAIGTGILSIIGVLSIVALAPIAVVTPIWFLSARSVARAKFERAHTALEQVLDNLERGDKPAPPSLLNELKSVLPRSL